jgi:ATP-dependent helicase YprA (DUF1998 family)
MVEWKMVRITKEAWRKLKRAVAGYEVDMDDFLSYVIETADLDGYMVEYLKVLEKEEEEEVEEEEAEEGEEEELEGEEELEDEDKFLEEEEEEIE